jgi:hypothetical protein
MHAARAGRRVDRDVAVVGGIGWRLRCQPAAPGLVELAIDGTGTRVSVDRADLPKIEPARFSQRLENAVAKLPAVLDDTITELAVLDGETTAAHSRLTSHFPAQDALDRLEADLVTLTAELAADSGNAAAPRRSPPVPGR